VSHWNERLNLRSNHFDPTAAASAAGATDADSRYLATGLRRCISARPIVHEIVDAIYHDLLAATGRRSVARYFLLSKGHGCMISIRHPQATGV